MTVFDGTFSDSDLAATLHGLGRDVFFVQIGAMDGVTHDPIHTFVRKLGWSGILVEPIPYLNHKLRANYASCDGLIFEDTAIADFEGRIDMAFVDPTQAGGGLFEPGGFGTSTLMRDRGILSGKDLPVDIAHAVARHTKTVEVSCCRLPILLAKHGVTRLDLFVVDVEGADWMVTRQLSLETYRPRLVYIEYAHLTQYEKLACAVHFQNHHYRIYLDQIRSENFMAIRNDGPRS